MKSGGTRVGVAANGKDALVSIAIINAEIPQVTKSAHSF